MPFFDTHAHLENEQLSQRVDELVETAAVAGVVGITAIGTTVHSSHECVKLSERFENVYAAVGIHPNNCAETSEDDWQLGNGSAMFGVGNVHQLCRNGHV